MKIGIDVGGTSIRVGLISTNQVLKSITKPCPAKSSENETLIFLKNIISELINDKIQGIGIGVPSVVDSEAGIVYNAANISSWKEVHLKTYLQNEFKIPTYVNNDANCFALGEKIFGEAKEFSNMVGITLGTGVGSGIIINNELYNGSNTGAGEIGSLPYLEYDYEHYCSSRFFVEHYGLTGKDAFDKALEKDKDALKIWDELGIHIGNLVIAMLYSYDPQAIVFGGSITHGFPFFSQAMYSTIAKFPYPKTIEKLQIKISRNTDISLLGAASLIQ